MIIRLIALWMLVNGIAFVWAAIKSKEGKPFFFSLGAMFCFVIFIILELLIYLKVVG